MSFFEKIIAWFITILSMLGFIGTPTTPEIKEGEFDFVLTYEIDGEIKTIEGT